MSVEGVERSKISPDCIQGRHTSCIAKKCECDCHK